MSLLTPPRRSECFQIIFEQLHGQRGVFRPTPPVALKAADQSLAVVVYFDQCAVAVAAGVVQCHRGRRLFVPAAP